jgi:hypothetical protein
MAVKFFDVFGRVLGIFLLITLGAVVGKLLIHVWLWILGPAL